jgi:hypothetical protein
MQNEGKNVENAVYTEGSLFFELGFLGLSKGFNRAFEAAKNN